jgi:hypothetical protein
MLMLHGPRQSQLLALLLLLILQAGCAVPTPGEPAASPDVPAGETAAVIRDPAAAQATLDAFLRALHEGRYADAAISYAGDYTNLRDWNPGIALDDHAALLQAGCEVSGLKCLEVVGIELGAITGDTQLFYVRFANADGSPFILVPPPGMPVAPQGEFELRVQWTADGPRVISLPPYVS